MLSQVTINITRSDGTSRDVWFLFETDHDNLSDLNDELADRGSIYGTRIDTEPAGPGQRREVKRYECIIARETVVTIITPQAELLPPEAMTVRA